MLKGTDEEIAYHEARAAEELARASACDEAIATVAHLKLANFHEKRAMLGTAIRTKLGNNSSGALYRTDKEA